jgi:polar amino acid transport system substrate-binding protein
MMRNYQIESDFAIAAPQTHVECASYVKMIVRCIQVLLILVITASAGSGTPAAVGTMSSTDDLKDKRIGVLLGSVYDTFASKAYPQATLLHFDTTSDLELAVSAGKVDAGISNEPALVEALRANDDLAMFGEPVVTLPVGFGFRKGNTELRDAFNRFLAGIKQNGVLADMVERWTKKQETRMPEIPAPKPGAGILVIAVSAAGLPFDAVQDGRNIGLNIELAERFAASIGKEIKFSQIPFAGLIAANATGKVDMIAAAMYITDERKQRIDFSDPYFEARGRAFALKANIGGAAPQTASGAARPLLSSTADLRDKRIAVQLGTVYDLYASNTFSGSTVMQFNTFQEVTLAVSAGKADAGLSDIDTFNEVKLANKDLVAFGKPIFTSEVAAGFAKSSKDLRASFNAFLKTIRENGTHADMADRWMTKRNTHMPEIPAPSSTNGTVVVGVSSGGFPFEAVQDGELTGYEIELAKRFAAYIGKELRLVDVDFGALIPALASGKIQVIIADMFVTEERQKQIDFSDAYFTQDSVAFTRVANTVAHGDSPVQQHSPSFTERIAASFRSNILAERRYLLLWDGLKSTALISIFSTIFGTALGAIVCFMRMSRLSVLRGPARLYIAVLRGTPIVVLLMMIFYVVFGSLDINPVIVAIIAFGMNFAAYVSEMFRAGIESIDRGQKEAGVAMGFSPLQTFGYIMLPQMVQRTLPVYTGEFVSLVKMTSVVGYIAVQDLTKAGDIIRSRTFDAFFPLIMVTVLYFVIAGGLMQGLRYLERRTDPKFAQRKGAVAR